LDTYIGRMKTSKLVYIGRMKTSKLVYIGRMKTSKLVFVCLKIKDDVMKEMIRS